MGGKPVDDELRRRFRTGKTLHDFIGEIKFMISVEWGAVETDRKFFFCLSTTKLDGYM